MPRVLGTGACTPCQGLFGSAHSSDGKLEHPCYHDTSSSPASEPPARKPRALAEVETRPQSPRHVSAPCHLRDLGQVREHKHLKCLICEWSNCNVLRQMFWKEITGRCSRTEFTPHERAALCSDARRGSEGGPAGSSGGLRLSCWAQGPSDLPRTGCVAGGRPQTRGPLQAGRDRW